MSSSISQDLSHYASNKPIDNIPIYKQLINGEEYESASGKWFTQPNPSNLQENVFSASLGDRDDVNKAVEAARKAFDEGPWANYKAIQRVQILEAAAKLIEEDIERLANLLHKETGRFHPFCGLEIKGSVLDVIRYNCAMALTHEGRSNTTWDPSQATITIHQPVGVVGAIIPWNFPLMLLTQKIAPALAAGCSVVIKPALFTTASTIEVVKLFLKAGVPAGNLNVVIGGNDVGESLVSHPGVDKITFTGSTETAKKVMASASTTLKRLTLEAGGKSPIIVGEDADIQKLMTMNPPLFILGCGLYHSGQVCAIGSRVLVHKSKKEQLIAALKGAFESENIKAITGAITFKEQLQKIQSYADIATKEGAKLVTGGHVRTDGETAKGLFFEGTIFTDVTPKMRIWNEEVFGPFTCITEFETIEEAIVLANSVQQGLAAVLFTNNMSHILKLSKEIKAGFIMVNKFAAPGPHEPFGGMKQSGIGRENGYEGYTAFLEQKTVSISI